MLYVLPFTDNEVNSSVRTELPAKRPALFTSATRPTISAPDGITVSPPSTMGLLSEPWQLSPTCFRWKSSELPSRTVSCVPAGIVTICGGAGGCGGDGGICCTRGAEGGVSSASRTPAPAFSASFPPVVRWRAAFDSVSDIYSLLGFAGDGLGAIRREGRVARASCTWRLLTTVFTPSIAAASLAAAARSG